MLGHQSLRIHSRPAHKHKRTYNGIQRLDFPFEADLHTWGQTDRFDLYLLIIIIIMILIIIIIIIIILIIIMILIILIIIIIIIIK
jgi:hypothetical protein